jgi:hypothetical protein
MVELVEEYWFDLLLTGLREIIDAFLQIQGSENGAVLSHHNILQEGVRWELGDGSNIGSLDHGEELTARLRWRGVVDREIEEDD